MTSASTERKALLTGATGFVGSRLAQKLVAAGWQVTVILRPHSDLSELNPVLSEIHTIRVPTDKNLNQAVASAAPDVVFHLASKFLAEHRPEDVADMVQSNVEFGTRLLEATTNIGVSRFINVGTSWQHFRTSEYKPVCLYAATKQAFDAILDYYVDARSLRTITLKLFDTYGPDDPRKKLFGVLRSARASKTPVAMSPGEQWIDLVYIDDIVDGFMSAANRLLHGECTGKEDFALSSGSPRQLREIADVYQTVVGENLNIDWGARPYRKREVMSPWASGKQIPGWRPKVSLAEGIRRTEHIAGNEQKL